MTPTEMISPEDNTSKVRSDMNAQSLYDKCMAVASNLWWMWQPEVTHLFRDLDPIRWRQLDHNPIALLKEFTPERLDQRATEMVLYSRIHHRVSTAKGLLIWLFRDLVGDQRGRFGCQASGLFFRRVWDSRVGTHLLRRARSLIGRPHQERKRSRNSACRRRVILRPRLFQTATERRRVSNGRLRRHKGRESARAAGLRRGRQAANGLH